jgi:hypothetical protein
VPDVGGELAMSTAQRNMDTKVKLWRVKQVHVLKERTVSKMVFITSSS